MEKKEVIISFDGGGAKGIMHSAWLTAIEKQVGVQIYNIADLLLGTSVGAISAGLMASGKISGEDYLHLMKKNIKLCFKKRLRVPILQPKYSPNHLRGLIREVLGEMRLGETKTKLVITAASLMDGRNHFFKSYDENDADRLLADVISYSWAAPLYFGKVDDPNHRQVWVDGGTGSMNSPIDEALTEALNLKYFCTDERNKAHLLSLGCGHTFHRYVSYEDASKFNNVGQVMAFLDPSSGGMARGQIEANKIQLLSTISRRLPNFSFNRVEPIIMPEAEGLDKVEYADYYLSVASDEVHKINMNPLKERMAENGKK